MLRARARREGKSLAAVIREIIDAHLGAAPRPEASDDFTRVIGLGTGDGSRVAERYTMSLLTKRLGKAIAVRFGQGIRGSSAFRIFTTQLDRDYDLIDCPSFAMMDAFDVREVFGFDQHFARYGFRLLPG
jgi:hypothetical protein